MSLFDQDLVTRPVGVIVQRTFHPVGQGAFYSERFYTSGQSEAVYNIVYDCGTSWGSVLKAKKVVTQAFDNKDVIHYLFISHLDYDHISLALTLIESVNSVYAIVLPLVQIDDLVVGIALNRISNHNDAANFLQRVFARLGIGGNGENIKPLQSDIVFVGNEEDIRPQNSKLWRNGEGRSIGNMPDWVLIPYNVNYQNRKKELITEFAKLLHEAKIRKLLTGCSTSLPASGEELYDKLKDPHFVSRVLADRELKNAIKSAYEKVTGGVNANSLLLYSGPSNNDAGYRLVSDCNKRCGCYRVRRPGGSLDVVGFGPTSPEREKEVVRIGITQIIREESHKNWRESLLL